MTRKTMRPSVSLTALAAALLFSPAYAGPVVLGGGPVEQDSTVSVQRSAVALTTETFLDLEQVTNLGVPVTSESIEGVVGGSSITEAMPFDSFPYETSDVPEPGTLLLMGLGLVGLSYARRRRSD